MDAVDTVELFSEKIRRLDSSLLVKFFEEQGFKVSFNFRKNELNSGAIVPMIDLFEGYVLNLRFFIQNNEPISLSKLAQLYDKECSNVEIKHMFDKVHHTINSELDRICPFRFNDEEVSYRTIFDGMIYTRLAHSNKTHHRVFSEMTKHPFGYYLALDAFVRCIKMIHENLAVIDQLNKKAFCNKREGIQQ
jgi:hypothetical protein